MPISYPGGTVAEHTAVRDGRRRSSTSATWASCRSPGRARRRSSTAASPPTWAGSRPARPSTRCAAPTTAGSSTTSSSTWSGPDEVLAVPNAANAARGGRAAAGGRAGRRRGHRPAPRTWPCSPCRGRGRRRCWSRCCPGPRTSPGWTTWPSPTSAGDPGVPHRLHRRARLRAARPGGRRAARCGTRCSPPRSRWAAGRAGLAARDTLRTEMGYPLHGQDLSARHHPGAGGQRVGGRLDEAGVLGTRRRWSRRRRPGRRGGCAGCGPPGAACRGRG